VECWVFQLRFSKF